MGDTPALTALIDACLARLGQDSFLDPFLTLVGQADAAQVMIFSYAPDHASCLLSRNFRTGALGARLAADYLDGWFRMDPVFTDILELQPGISQQARFDELALRMPPAYRTRFFDAPALTGKFAVLIVGERLRLVLNLYWHHDAIEKNDLASLLARLALMHFEARPENSLPAPLTALSERERAVCLGILEGKKAEQIAADLGVAPSSVITYRRRAYAKLGINSRGSLFAICRP